MGQPLTAESEPVNLLMYGNGGTGKTTHLAHMSSLGKVLIVNAENGVKARALDRQGVSVDNIEVFPAPGETLTVDTLQAEWLRVREALNDDPDAYAGFVLDSVTEIYKHLLDPVQAAGEEKAERGGKRDTRSEYGEVNEQVRKLIRRCRDLPCHFGVSALERREVDEQDGSVAYWPSITPGLQGDLFGWHDIVCHTEVVQVGDTEQYRGSFRPIGKYRSKDRFGVLPKVLVNPTFDRILAYVEEELRLLDATS